MKLEISAFAQNHSPTASCPVFFCDLNYIIFFVSHFFNYIINFLSFFIFQIFFAHKKKEKQCVPLLKDATQQVYSQVTRVL